MIHNVTIIIFKPASRYFERNIYNCVLKVNFTSNLITVPMRISDNRLICHPLPIYIHTSFIHIDLEHNLFLVYKIMSKNMLCYKNIWNLKKKDAAVVFISKESARWLIRPILFVMVLISQTSFLGTLLWKINSFDQNYNRIKLSYFTYLLFYVNQISPIQGINIWPWYTMSPSYIYTFRHDVN